MDNEVTARSMADNTITIQFSDSKVPEFKEVKGKQFVYFGEDNLYPDYLIKLYNKSAKHNAIINGKVNYIFGEGFYTNVNDPIADKFLFKVNSAGESLNDIAKKCAIDIEIFGGFYLNIIPNKLGKMQELYHLDFTRVRANEDGSQFFYKNEWSNHKEKPKEYGAFNPYKLDCASIFQYKEYRPGLRTYPLPNYIGSMNYIEADMEVSKHTLTNAKTGFSATKLINFFNGEPAPEMQRDIQKRLEKKFTGSDGSKIIVSFNNDPTKAPTVQDLGASDLTKEDFEKVDNLITSNIFAGHQITSPMLFGIQEPGKLGGRNELRMAYDIFNNTYVSNKQRTLEKVFNYLAKFKDITNLLYIRAVDPVGVEFSDVTLLQAAPRSWLLEKMGIDTTKYVDPPVGNKSMPPQPPTPPGDIAGAPTQKLAETNSILTNLTAKQHQQISRIVRQFTKGQLTKEQASLMLKNGFGFTSEDVAAYLGLDAAFSKDYNEVDIAMMFNEIGEDAKHYDFIESKKVDFLSNEDSEVFEKEFQFDENTSLTQKIKDAVKKLTTGLPGVIGEIKKTLPEIEIRYTYEKNPEASGASVLPTTRPFCAALVNSGKSWSRVQIEQISERVGYSVWNRRGGFWNHGKGEGTTAYCRHIWKANIVLKKK
jgi:hypothetical protein